MMKNKWILEDGHIVMGKVNFHHDLANDSKKVTGGGLFIFDAIDRVFKFFGRSAEFGVASAEDVLNAIKSGKVYTCRLRKQSITDKFTFEFQDENFKTHKV